MSFIDTVLAGLAGAGEGYLKYDQSRREDEDRKAQRDLLLKRFKLDEQRAKREDDRLELERTKEENKDRALTRQRTLDPFEKAGIVGASSVYDSPERFLTRTVPGLKAPDLISPLLKGTGGLPDTGGVAQPTAGPDMSFVLKGASDTPEQVRTRALDFLTTNMAPAIQKGRDVSADHLDESVEPVEGFPGVNYVPKQEAMSAAERLMLGQMRAAAQQKVAGIRGASRGASVDPLLSAGRAATLRRKALDDVAQSVLQQIGVDAEPDEQTIAAVLASGRQRYPELEGVSTEDLRAALFRAKRLYTGAIKPEPEPLNWFMPPETDAKGGKGAAPKKSGGASGGYKSDDPNNPYPS